MASTEGTYKCTLSKELLKIAEKELHEKPKHRTRDIQFLRERVLANKGKYNIIEALYSTLYER